MRLILVPLLALLPLALTQSSSGAASSAVRTAQPSTPSTVISSSPPSSVPTTQPPTSAPVTVPPTSSPISSSVVPSSQPVTSQPVTTSPPSSIRSTISSSIISSANVSRSANVTSSSAMPNATVVPVLPPFYDDRGDDTLVDDINMDLGDTAFEADEKVLTLAYMANLNQQTCNRIANDYATGSSSDLRRHFADVEYARRKRKRATYPKRCLAIQYEIPTYVHWILPAGETKASWTSESLLGLQLAVAQVKLNQLGATIKLVGTKVWGGETGDSFTTNKWAYNSKEYKSYIDKIKKEVGATGSRNLHIFIVKSMGGSFKNGKQFRTLGRANWPGKAADAAQADAVILIKDNLPPITGKALDPEDTKWATLPHEIGHWLGLFHLHDNGPGGGDDGCKGKGDLVGGTLRYANGQSYDMSCGGTDMGPKGLYETNIMSYAKGVTWAQGRFIPEQRVRATVGWLIRRDGLKGTATDIRRVYTAKDCDTASKVLGRSIRYDDVWPDSVVGPHKRELSIRATAAELQRFCARTDLVIPDYDFSPIAEGGMYNADSAPIPNNPTAPVTPVQVGTPADMSGVTYPSGVASPDNFAEQKQKVEAQVASGAPVLNQPYVTPAAVTVTVVPTSGGGTSGALKTTGWVSGLGIGGVILGAMMVL